MFKTLILPAVLAFSSVMPAVASDDLARDFARPPQTARPWVYWFWLNSNITKTGITADLEAMKRVGIGGVLIMEVDQGAPVGQVPFMSDRWREMFRHAVAEAQRLGLEVNMNDDAGWNGSGGPWIRPEQSMQEVVWTETEITGPMHYEGVLPRPQVKASFYREIAVLAVPDSGNYRLPDFEAKAAFQSRGHFKPAATQAEAPSIIKQDRVIDLTARMTPDGRLAWDVPAGKWIVLRLGHTSTGSENQPAPASGRGLECDKLSSEGIEANFAGMMAKLTQDVGPAAGKALVATHIDSWENGSQNWTARMREEFQRRRGYGMTPLLPVMTGRVVGSPEISERFLWDLRRTISELVVANYAGRMSQLAHQHGPRPATAERHSSWSSRASASSGSPSSATTAAGPMSASTEARRKSSIPTAPTMSGVCASFAQSLQNLVNIRFASRSVVITTRGPRTALSSLTVFGRSLSPPTTPAGLTLRSARGQLRSMCPDLS